jgi:cation diffusion facilitator CzcD-associated flavoprotein CzcO
MRAPEQIRPRSGSEYARLGGPGGSNGSAPRDHDAIVIGAGPAGLAAALALKDRGVHSLVVDRGDRIASSWHQRYEGLRLNTWRRYSQLPDRPFRTGTPTFPTRNQVIEYLQHHAGEGGLEIRLRTAAERIEWDDRAWLVRTDGGDLRAPAVVVATGYENRPVIPDWSGRDGWSGQILHSSEYRNPEPFHGRSVLVAGPGSSGMEIAQELVEGGAAKVWLGVRTPPNMLGRRGPAGIPGDAIAVVLWHLPAWFGDRFTRFARKVDFGDLSEYGLPIPEEGVISRARRLGKAPTIVDEDVIEAIKDGRIEVVSGVEAFDAEGIELADGERIEPDAVICATGFRRALERLAGDLDVLDEDGVPRVRGGSPAADGLFFIGYVPRPGGLGFMAKEAERAAKAIARENRARSAKREVETAG